MNRLPFMPGEQGKAFAAILGVDADRITKEASVVIDAGGFAVANIQIALTAEELTAIVEMLTTVPAVQLVG